ncbi:MAG: AAA family ATPase [Pirellulaceae bacterium]
MSQLNQQAPSATQANQKDDAKLDELLARLQSLTGNGPAHAPVSAPVEEVTIDTETTFVPRSPKTFDEAGINDSMLEELISKFLLARGEATMRSISQQVRLPFSLVEPVVSRMKQEQSLGYAGQAAANDYLCRLTETGRERAKRFSDICSYFGSAPVTFEDYIESVKNQTINNQNPTEEDLKRAFSDLLINPLMLRKLGPAVNSGRGMFLYGYPGNGKTSIAERVTSSFGKYIWVPRAIQIDRDIVRLFDPMNHEEAPLDLKNGYLSDDSIDLRWVRIKRPTIVVGGELKLEHLEIQYNAHSGVSEAPVQMKSNCGTLVIDDFGRQQCTVDELLNRWIVPLEKRYDYLNTSSGKKVQVPFDQLVIFSTNLEPKDLVDDAFCDGSHTKSRCQTLRDLTSKSCFRLCAR